MISIAKKNRRFFIFYHEETEVTEAKKLAEANFFQTPCSPFLHGERFQKW